jgi:ABC-type lipoprotein export system ATPase subunit/predicted metal-dependent phosphoesterase TrpH
MNDPRGSVWRKWDLHVHTPASFHWNEGINLAKRTPGDRDIVLDELIEKVVASDVAVFGIMDYWTFDGYLAIRERLAARKLTIQKAIFPGMELRIEAPVDFRLNIQVVLSDALTKQQLQDFKMALRIGAIDRALSNESLVAFARTLDPSKAEVHGFQEADLKDEEKLLQLGSMTALVTRESLRAAIKQVPPDTCLVILPYDTSDGLSKLEWAKHPHDDNYFMQSAHMFETREPDNVDLFHGRETDKNRKFIGNFRITMGGKPKPAISGSDAHKITDYGAFPSNRITWIKADPTFEGLRQTLYEPLSRVAISADKPLEPLLAIRKVVLNFPTDTKLVSEVLSENQPDLFCFRGNTEVTFSPYLTCLIGGRGSGKSTLLNLIHEKLEPGKTKFFNENSLTPEEAAKIASCVSIDGDAEQKVVEFLQQNEIEQFASAPLGFTEAIFNRLAKLDKDGKLAAVNAELLPAMADTFAQGDRLKAHDELATSIATAEKELASARALIASFENEEYKAINAELGSLNKELQALRNWRARLEALIRDIRVLRGKQNFPPSENPNAYEVEFFALLKSIDDISAPVQGRASLAAAQVRETALAEAVAGLRQKLEAFLKGRGLSPENLADVGKANERVAQIEQELPAQKLKATEVAAQIAAFAPKRELTAKRAGTVTALLEPLNKTLSELGKEVRAIELRYEFDETQFEQAMTKHIQELLGANAPRIDHLASMLEGVDFANLTTREDFVSKLPERQATAKLLRDYFSIPLNFALLKVEVEKKQMDFSTFGRIRVSYDGKPVESSSFGQRCTTAIVILLLLGNTPIVIDEPEAHLDSALIANYLVELVKTAKLNRQIIFATHNANFVVNGDAELIHVLEMGGDKVSKIQSITIEDLAHRGKLLALEGGREAFLKREHRYGIA